MGMLDEIPVIKKRTVIINQTTKLLCYTDGLVEVIEDNEVAYGTTAIEKQLSNTDPIQLNMDSIIQSQSILSDSKSVFDDVTMLGVEFF
jgi:phosphoserine phosphatase RsbU/P